MRTTLTDSEIRSYRENGFLAIPDFLDADEIAEWRDAFDEAVSGRTTLLPDGRGLGDDARKQTGKLAGAEPVGGYYGRVFRQRVNLWKTTDRMRKLVLDPRLGQTACELEGIGGIRLWHDQALIKEPYANPTAFHLDVPYWSFDSTHALSLWLALDDATPFNGCMCYIPGSHKVHRFDNSGIGPDLDALFEVYPEWRHVAPSFCPVPAGGAVYHNGLTAHGAGANMTPGYRRAMTCQYMPDGATFNGKQNILSDEQMERLSIGDPLDDPEQNPLLWSREPVRA